MSNDEDVGYIKGKLETLEHSHEEFKQSFESHAQEEFHTRSCLMEMKKDVKTILEKTEENADKIDAMDERMDQMEKKWSVVQTVWRTVKWIAGTIAAICALNFDNVMKFLAKFGG